MANSIKFSTKSSLSCASKTYGNAVRWHKMKGRKRSIFFSSLKEERQDSSSWAGALLIVTIRISQGMHGPRKGRCCLTRQGKGDMT